MRQTAAQGSLRNLQDLSKAVKSGETSPLYTIYGSDQYLLDKLHESLVTALQADAGAMASFNFDMLDGSVAAFQELAAMVDTAPMGGGRRIVSVKNLGFLKGGAQPTPMQRVDQAEKALSLGNETRALSLLFKAMEIDPAPLDSSAVQSKLEALRAEAADRQPDLLPFLDGAPERLESAPIPETSADNDQDRFFEWLEGGRSAASTLILRFDSPPPKGVLTRLGKSGTLANVDTLLSQKRRGKDSITLFIESQLKKQQISIEPSAVKILRDRANNNLQLITDEIEKLSAYVGRGGKISPAEAEAVVSDSSEQSVFNLMDAVGERKLEAGLSALHNLLMNGEPALRILAMFIRQTRLMKQAVLLKAAGQFSNFKPSMSYRAFTGVVYRKWDDALTQRLPSNSSLNLLKQSPYAMYKIMTQAARFTPAELDAAYQRLLEADEALKSSGASEFSILQHTVLELMRGEKTLKDRP